MTALSEPLRRRFSRAAPLMSREKLRAASQNSGAITSAMVARLHSR